MSSLVNLVLKLHILVTLIPENKIFGQFVPGLKVCNQVGQIPIWSIIPESKLWLTWLQSSGKLPSEKNWRFYLFYPSPFIIYIYCFIIHTTRKTIKYGYVITHCWISAHYLMLTWVRWYEFPLVEAVLVKLSWTSYYAMCCIICLFALLAIGSVFVGWIVLTVKAGLVQIHLACWFRKPSIFWIWNDNVVLTNFT